MNKLFIALGIVFVILVGLFIAFDLKKVPAGHVGVLVNLYANDKGVQQTELGTGRYWLTWNEELYLFPTFSQNQFWTQGNDPQDGSPNDEGFRFSDRDGLQLSADLGLTYRVDPDRVNVLFQTYRRGIDEITDTFLWNQVSRALVNEASRMKVDDIYGEGRGPLLQRVEDQVRAEVADKGIILERLYWVGEVRVPAMVKDALNEKVSANQRAQQRQNEIAQAQAEAQKERERAQGEADARLIVARAEAEAIRIRAEALAQNRNLVELQAVEKWDGVLPQYMLGGGVTPFVTLPQGAAQQGNR